MSKFYVGITDFDWLSFLSAEKKGLDSSINFWTPGTTNFKALNEGDYFLFKLHNKKNSIEHGEIVGGGIFDSFQVMTIEDAWNKFGYGNGCHSISEMREKINSIKKKNNISSNSLIGCIVLKNYFFLEKKDWLKSPKDWANSIVKGKTYDDTTKEGKEIIDSIRFKTTQIQSINIIEEICKDMPIEGKVREAYIKARVNQGVFKDRLMKKGSKCCLCNTHNPSLLIASHIKPWSKSDNYEKLDPYNGFLMCPNHDALFDKGYISFEDDGKIMISEQLDNTDRIYTNVNDKMKINIEKENTIYLKYHRENIFKK